VLLRSSGVAARVVSAIVIAWADSFRDAYQQTGMNLPQSVIMCAMTMGRRCWRTFRSDQ
jgi:hypothetical protein